MCIMTLFMLKHTCACAHICFRVHNASRGHTHKVLLVGKKISMYNISCISVLSLTQVCVGFRKVAVSTFVGKREPYVLVSLASLCMISKIILQAEEHPSGVEWTLMAFSAAPAFSFLCTSILRTTSTGWLVSRPWGKWVFFGLPQPQAQEQLYLEQSPSKAEWRRAGGRARDTGPACCPGSCLHQEVAVGIMASAMGLPGWGSAAHTLMCEFWISP